MDKGTRQISTGFFFFFFPLKESLLAIPHSMWNPGSRAGIEST